MKGIQAAAIGGSALILLILALRLTLKNHLPRRLLPALWCVAALRLLLPVEIPTRLSVWNLLRGTAKAQTAPSASALLPFPQLASAQTAPAAEAGPDWRLLVWLGIAALLAAYFAVGYLCVTRRFRARRMLPQPSVDALLERFRFARDPKICVTGSRRAPLTFGIFRPTVLLPDDLRAGQAQFQLVLAHELAHIRRKDCLRKLLLTACLCLYWWNPLVWIMVRLANRDMELACDEAVLRVLGPACKKSYALALLDMAQRQARPSPLCSGFAKSCAEERVRAILRFRRLPVWTGALAAALFLLAAGVLATQARSVPRVPEAPAVMQTQPEQSAPPAAQPVIHIDPVVNPAPAEPAAPAYVWPLENADAAVTGLYGWKIHPVTKKESFHNGLDLDAEAGQNVLAAAAGTVIDCGYVDAYGYYVTLEHADGVQTMYAHLRSFYVESGDAVTQGQVIAAAGATGWVTGPQLHLSVFIDGETVDPFTALTEFQYLLRGEEWIASIK